MKATLFPELEKKTFCIRFTVPPIHQGVGAVQAHTEEEAIKKWKRQNRYADIQSVERKEECS